MAVRNEAQPQPRPPDMSSCCGPCAASVLTRPDHFFLRSRDTREVDTIVKRWYQFPWDTWLAAERRSRLGRPLSPRNGPGRGSAVVLEQGPFNSRTIDGIWGTARTRSRISHLPEGAQCLMLIEILTAHMRAPALAGHVRQHNFWVAAYRSGPASVASDGTWTGAGIGRQADGGRCATGTFCILQVPEFAAGAEPPGIDRAAAVCRDSGVKLDADGSLMKHKVP